MNEKQIPRLVSASKDDCCGCSACYAICPTKSITMEEDIEGFLYPVVDEASCVGCFKCLKVCSFKENKENYG